MKTASRIEGFDLIRTLSFFTIATHHFGSKLWNLPLFTPFAESNKIWKILEVNAHLLSFSGQTILFLTTFLMALTSSLHEKAKKMIPILFLLWIVSNSFDYTPDTFFFSWDIFPLIAVGLIGVLFFYQLIPKARLALPTIGFILLSIPFWRSETLNAIPLFFRQILIGDCINDLSDWPILPWIGLVFVGYGLGFLAKEYQKGLLHFFKNEKYFWSVLLIWTPIYWGAYYVMPLGNRFACEGMRQEPLAFLAHLFSIIFLMRIMMLEKIRQKLKSSPWIVRISNLEINQNFGIAYFFHFFLIDLIIYFAQAQIANSPNLSAAIAIGLLPLTEISLRGLNIGFQRLKKFSHYFQ